MSMKRFLLIIIMLTAHPPAFAVNVKGPDTYAIFGILLVPVISVALVYLIFRNKRGKNQGSTRKKGSTFFRRRGMTLSLRKNRLYYPDYLIMTVINTRTSDLDIDNPLLIFSNFWIKRKFRLKGTGDHVFYPLLLEAGKKHDLTIDLNHFYRHDKRLKRYPKVTICIRDVSGRFSVSKSTMLRKTLFS